MRRLWSSLSASALALVLGFIAPPSASAQQSVNLHLGGFVPRAQDARGTDDVLFKNGNFLKFTIKDFDGATFGGEWLIGLGDLVDAGIGIGYYQRTVPSVYARLVNSDGSEIAQDMKLRIVPITATVRLLPLGHDASIRPYIGAGVGVLKWRYSESGQFVDQFDNTIFRDTFIGTGTNAGPVVLGGVIIPIGNVGLGGEIRYQSARGRLPTPDWNAGTKIDLGGLNYLFVVNIRF